MHEIYLSNLLHNTLQSVICVYICIILYLCSGLYSSSMLLLVKWMETWYMYRLELQ